MKGMATSTTCTSRVPVARGNSAAMRPLYSSAGVSAAKGPQPLSAEGASSEATGRPSTSTW